MLTFNGVPAISSPSVRQLQRNRSNYLAPLGLKQLTYTRAGKSGPAARWVPELHSQESLSHLQTGYGEKTGFAAASERTTKTRLWKLTSAVGFW